MGLCMELEYDWTKVGDALTDLSTRLSEGDKAVWEAECALKPVPSTQEALRAEIDRELPDWHVKLDNVLDLLSSEWAEKLEASETRNASLAREEQRAWLKAVVKLFLLRIKLRRPPKGSGNGTT